MRASRWTINPIATTSEVRFTVTHSPKEVQVTLLRQIKTGQSLRLRIRLEPKDAAELAYSILSPNGKVSKEQ